MLERGVRRSGNRLVFAARGRQPGPFGSACGEGTSAAPGKRGRWRRQQGVIDRYGEAGCRGMSIRFLAKWKKDDRLERKVDDGGSEGWIAPKAAPTRRQRLHEASPLTVISATALQDSAISRGWACACSWKRGAILRSRPERGFFEVTDAGFCFIKDKRCLTNCITSCTLSG